MIIIISSETMEKTFSKNEIFQKAANFYVGKRACYLYKAHKKVTVRFFKLKKNQLFKPDNYFQLSVVL